MKNREKMVVLRAEMDALPVQECTGLAYASRNKGCMHACGHDGILAVALTLAKILSGQKDFPVAVRFLFEPAEEIGEGTVRMLDGGALDKDKGRKADGFLMFHYACDQPLGMAVHKGQASAMIGKMEILIKGKSSHWCQAEKGLTVFMQLVLSSRRFMRSAAIMWEKDLMLPGSAPYMAGNILILFQIR